jgi:putative ABC transport system permease protein
VLQRFGFLSRSSQLGIRSAARSKQRSVSTGLQIGLAAGTALAFIALGATMVFLNNQTFDVEAGDIHLFEQGGRALDSSTAGIVESIPGVAAANPVHYAAYGYRGENYSVWALPADTVFEYDLVVGRWFEVGESEVVVVGQALAAVEGIQVGDVITVERFDGPLDVMVVGIDRLLVNDGQVFFAPLASMLEAGGRTSSNAYWIETLSPDEATVNAAAGGVEQALRDRGHAVSTELRYIERAANQSEAALILTFIVLLGVPVLAIGMIALVSTMTTNVVERTKEIGVLRSIGARRRHLGKMLRAEALAVAFVGWLLAIPLGFGLARLLIWLISRAFNATFPVIFPLWSVVPVLILTLVVAALVTRVPLRRVARMRPGEALRYE